MIARSAPVHPPHLATSTILDRIKASGSHGYSGTVDLAGNVKLPVASRFTDIGPLLGGRTTLRVWWRDRSEWRVDKLLIAGETDLFHEGTRTTQWEYEAAKATVSEDPAIRLPRSEDLIPPVLAARLLKDAGADEVRRLAPRRVAGVSAVGVEVRPRSSKSSIGRLDLWADPETGIVLRADLYAVGSTQPAFSTAFTSFTSKTPSSTVTRFAAPTSVPVRFESVLDIADAANQYAPVIPPKTVAGLRRTGSAAGAVGVYGTGLVQVLVVPLRGRDADTLREQLDKIPGVRQTPDGPTLMAGPLGVLVSGGHEQPWLIVGSVSRATLAAVARDLRSGARYRYR
ncbi:MAG TPA: hypothetical protein VFE15_11360 [Marmoricola sp.]|nr:hypothetical protein [Marmoricola sp.]